MTYLRTLGLAAIAAMALIAFAGSGTASATTVCTEGATTSPCLSGQEPYEGEIAAELAPGTEAVLTGSVNVKCSTSAVTGTTNSAGEGEITGTTFENCTTCPTVKSQTPWNAQATATSKGNGTMTIEKPVVVLSGCFGFATCTASAASVTLDVTGGNPAVIKAINEPLSMSGFGCGSSGTWNATYETTTPSSGLWLE